MSPACLDELEPRLLFVTSEFTIPGPPPPPPSVTLTPDGTLIVLGHYTTTGLSVRWYEDRANGFQIIDVSDSWQTLPQFHAASVKRVVIEGGGGADTLRISVDVNLPATLVGGDGNDTMFGGRGDEWLIGEAGNDEIYAGDGNDIVHAGAGNDMVYGGDGNDTILGLNGNDVLGGGWGQDSLDGGRGGDHLLGENSNDFLEGGPDNDILDGGAGTDTLYGGDGNDYLIGGRGIRDSMRGGMGNDKFRADDILGNGDSMWGEAGFDVLVSAADADDLFVRGPQTR